MADDLHGRHVLVLNGQMHVDGVLADRPVLAVDRIVAIRVVAGVLLVGCCGIRVGTVLVASPSSAVSPDALPSVFDFSSCDCTLSPELPAYSSSIGVAFGSPHADNSAMLAADSAMTLTAFDCAVLMPAPLS